MNPLFLYPCCPCPDQFGSYSQYLLLSGGFALELYSYLIFQEFIRPAPQTKHLRPSHSLFTFIHELEPAKLALKMAASEMKETWVTV